MFYTDLEIQNIHLISQKREDIQWLNLRYFLKVIARITEKRTELTFLVSADIQRQAEVNWPGIQVSKGLEDIFSGRCCI